MSQENLFHGFFPCGCFDSFDYQEESFIKEFDYWFLILNHQQGFLGRSLLILKAHKADEWHLTRSEVLEKHDIYCRWRKSIASVFSPDKINQAQLGNEEHLHGGHLHWHWVPRYRRPISFEDVQFPYDTLETQKLNYSRVADRTVYPIELRVKIKKALLKGLKMLDERWLQVHQRWLDWIHKHGIILPLKVFLSQADPGKIEELYEELAKELGISTEEFKEYYMTSRRFDLPMG